MIVGRQQDPTDRITKILESNGYLVSSTLSEITAIDLATSSEFDAVVIGREVLASDRSHLRSVVRGHDASTVVIIAQSPESVMTQLNQGFKEMRGAAID